MLCKATITDAKNIYALIHYWAQKRVVLQRSLNYIYENIRDYWVFKEKGRLIGACALHCVGWQDLGEVKSLVVDKRRQGKGIGSALVGACIQEARELKIKHIFALTFVPSFFKKMGFRKIAMNKLPHKIWSDCLNCAYFPNCKEQALMLALGRSRLRSGRSKI